MRERVEDLGRISVMTNQLLDLDVWDVYCGRNKDFGEFFRSRDEDQQDELLHNLIYGLDRMKGILHEIGSIAEGTDRLNESS